MKVYIASPWECRPFAQTLAALLDEQGHVITSRWLFDDATTALEQVQHDLSDLELADVLVAYNPVSFEKRGTGGRHVEFGYALSLGKKIVVLGVRSNIFHAVVDVVETTEQLVRWLAPVEHTETLGSE